MSKFNINKKTSASVQGASQLLTLLFVLLAIIVGITIFGAIQSNDSDIMGNVLMAVILFVIILTPFYIIGIRLIKGFAKIVEASESITEYINYINEQKEENESEKA